MKEFKRKTALITGAGNGFGAEFAKEAAMREMRLVLVDIDEADVQRTLAMQGDGGRRHSVNVGCILVRDRKVYG